MKASNVSNLLFEQLKFRSDRQKIISSNIANVNTPNYKTKDISFIDTLTNKQDKNDLKLETTSSMHISQYIQDNQNKNNINYFETQGLEEQNDGNNVNMDQQISQMAQNQIMHTAISNSIKKDSNWFKFILDASSKN
jgi:flagellar basal-body rod protein FlgB